MGKMFRGRKFIVVPQRYKKQPLNIFCKTVLCYSLGESLVPDTYINFSFLGVCILVSCKMHSVVVKNVYVI